MLDQELGNTPILEVYDGSFGELVVTGYEEVAGGCL
jgi:hypothetical protein